MKTKQIVLGALAAGSFVAAAGCEAPSGEERAGEAHVASASAAVTAPGCANSAAYEIPGVGGALFNTLAVDTAILPMWQVGKVLANDQIHMLRMASDAGLAIRDKHVPAYVTFDATGNVVRVDSGGFYQCATLADCQRYLTDVVGQYRLDGTAFAARPEFHGSFEGHAYEVIGAAKFREVPEDYAIKITRWRVTTPGWNPRAFLAQRWAHQSRDEACQRGTLAQAHLLWSEAEGVVAEVTIGAKVEAPPGNPTPYFVATLGALAAQDVLDPLLDRVPLARIAPAVTNTYLVLTYWPSALAPGRWPNSSSATPGGPLPEPFCGDGSCNTTVTHVENASTCPVDCAPGCGDGTCAGGETASTCAVDCRP
ncbi:MAG: hypothetical protein JWP87_1000 [Labilithrix sp.]|nr:hypothetical protein [Labilithrix sp.]